MSYDITTIPGTMRKMGWTNGAALMDRWFALPSNGVPENGFSDTSTIKMSWVLGFSRAKEVYNEIVTQKLWFNTPAKSQIQRWLTNEGKLAQKDTSFGGPMQNVLALDSTYVQARYVGSVWDPLDDMYGALGKFAFRVAVAGNITFQKATSKHKIAIREVGIYLRDSYDFNGEQSLGHWSDGIVGKLPVPFVTTEVTNKDFRDWRAANGKGGDFLLYSDVMLLKRTTPDVFEV